MYLKLRSNCRLHHSTAVHPSLRRMELYTATSDSVLYLDSGQYYTRSCDYSSLTELLMKCTYAAGVYFVVMFHKSAARTSVSCWANARADQRFWRQDKEVLGLERGCIIQAETHYGWPAYVLSLINETGTVVLHTRYGILKDALFLMSGSFLLLACKMCEFKRIGSVFSRVYSGVEACYRESKLMKTLFRDGQ